MSGRIYPRTETLEFKAVECGSSAPTSLVQPLFDGPIDIIGDVHGEIDAVRSLMRQLGYAGGDDWKASLRSTLQLADALDDNVRGMWGRNQDVAKQNNRSLSPEEFARMIVDQNFSSLIDWGVDGDQATVGT